MKYRKDKYGNDISVLGYGCMRFTRGIKTDVNKAEKELLEAFNQGVNYFDTAYIYPGSEVTLGTILQRNNIRDKVNITTKLPHYMIKSIDKAEKYFAEQLLRLKTDYINYYLFHMLTDIKSFERLKDLGILDWIKQKKESGEIKQIGFSYHGNSEMFCKIIDAYDWDICMIQYNYMDENSQAGRKGLEYAYSKGIPVVIMEPLRGGKLVNKLPKKAIRLLSDYKKKFTPAQLSFKWIWNQPEPLAVLSGMNSLDMVKENCQTANDTNIGELDADDLKLIEELKIVLKENTNVPCTGCGYCMPCPANVDIPGTFAAYNNQKVEGRIQGLIDYFMCTALRKDATSASNCIKCGKCEKHCPQEIPIRNELDNARKALEGPLYKIGKKVAPIFFKY